MSLEGAIVGVNSRNLRTLVTDLTVAHELARVLPAHRPWIAESGIRTRDEMTALCAAGYTGFLIGETLLRAQDPGDALRALLRPSDGDRA